MTQLAFNLTPPPVTPQETAVTREIRRRTRNADLVLARLQRGPATNVELNAICFRYGARIFELKGEGYGIEKRCVRRGLFEYRMT